MHLTKYVQSVVNLSFDNNNIREFDQLDFLKDIKLREIVLTNNPIQTQSTETKYQRYRYRLCRLQLPLQCLVLSRRFRLLSLLVLLCCVCCCVVCCCCGGGGCCCVNFCF